VIIGIYYYNLQYVTMANSKLMGNCWFCSGGLGGVALELLWWSREGRIYFNF